MAESIETLESRLASIPLMAAPVVANLAEAPGLHRLVLDVRSHVIASTHHRAGQYAAASVGSHEPRYFALASRPGHNELELLVGKSDGVSNALCEAHVGDSIVLSEALGDGYRIDKLTGHDVVVFSSGTGLASVRPLIEELLHAGPASRLAVLHSRPPELANVCRDDFRRWEQAGAWIVQTDGNAGQYVQEIYDASPRRLPADTSEFVVCGSPLMQAAVTDYLHGAGVTDEHIHFNY